MSENGSATLYKTKQDIVYTELYDAIAAGRYRPGERLDLNDIAARYGTSRTPVREALWRLESDGLLKVVPHHGFVVSKLPVQEIAEIYHIRAVLEGLAARLAAGQLSGDQARALREYVDAMQARLDSHNAAAVIDLNLPFHEIIFATAQSPLLHKYITDLYASTTRYRSMTITWPGRTQEIINEHRALAEAVIGGDANEAERIARLHQENNAKTVIAVAKSLGEMDESNDKVSPSAGPLSRPDGSGRADSENDSVRSYSVRSGPVRAF